MVEPSKQAVAAKRRYGKSIGDAVCIPLVSPKAEANETWIVFVVVTDTSAVWLSEKGTELRSAPGSMGAGAGKIFMSGGFQQSSLYLQGYEPTELSMSISCQEFAVSVLLKKKFRF